MDSIISAFHIDWKIIIAQAVNFAIVFAVLYVYALKPLGKLMDERSAKIKKGMDDAKTNAELLEQSRVESAAELARAQQKAQAMWQEKKAEAEQKATEMMAKTQNELKVMIEKGKKSLEAEKSKMVNDAKTEIASLAAAIAQKVLGSEKADPHLEARAVKELSEL